VFVSRMAERHFIVDPQIIAVPTDPTLVTDYVAGLAQWLPSLARRRAECSIVGRTVEALFEDGRFPTHEAIAGVLAKAAVREFSILDIRNLLRLLVETEPYLEHHTGFTCVAANRIEVNPPELIFRLGSHVGDALEQALAAAALAQEDGWCKDGVYWATLSRPRDCIWLNAKSHVVLAECLDRSLLQVDRNVEINCRIITQVDEFDSIGEISKLYRNPEEAVKLAVVRLRRNGVCCPTKLPEIAAGGDFVSSIETLGLHRQPAVLDTIFQRAALATLNQLANVTGAKLHPVRTAPAADAPQVERPDGARLWRCMVTKTGAGYRLHFWKLPSGAIELDSVMTESEC